MYGAFSAADEVRGVYPGPYFGSLANVSCSGVDSATLSIYKSVGSSG